MLEISIQQLNNVPFCRPNISGPYATFAPLPPARKPRLPAASLSNDLFPPAALEKSG
jgi:hypothetical protein